MAERQRKKSKTQGVPIKHAANRRGAPGDGIVPIWYTRLQKLFCGWVLLGNLNQRENGTRRYHRIFVTEFVRVVERVEVKSSTS